MGRRRGVSLRKVGPSSYTAHAFERIRLLHRKLETDRLAAWHLFNRLLERSRGYGRFGGVDLSLALRNWEQLDEAYQHSEWLRVYFWHLYRKECIREGKTMPRRIRVPVVPQARVHKERIKI